MYSVQIIFMNNTSGGSRNFERGGGQAAGGSGGHSPLGKILKFMMFSMPFLP